TATIPDLASGDAFKVETRFLGIPLDSNTFPVVVKLPELKDQSAFQVPVQDNAYWPLFRYDQRNTGSSPQPATFVSGETPWMFQTGKGVFSTPIIDHNGNIYIGSADHIFYSLSPSGRENWQFTSGEIIDSAAILPADYLENGKNTVIFPGGDGFIYCLNLNAAASGQDRLLWKFDARVSPRASFNNWFEGNIAVGYDGTLYAGNTNFNYYAISPDGQLDWTYPTAANDWSIAAIAPDGTIYWGSNDTFIRAVDSSGKEKWTVRTLGFIAASAAIGSDGTVYIGSFDSYLYALDPYDGHVKWKFKTNDHIYASVALGSDPKGNTNAIYFGSADGIFYALNPQGKLTWEYDTGDPIRSSAVLGASPHGTRDAIVYFGAGNGKLYALNTIDGTRRWSFDTTSSDPILADRNDLNSSPALGPAGVVIASESGQVWQVPYDYCLNVKDDPRCSTQPTTDLPETMSGMQYVTPGGSVELSDPDTLPVSTLITLKLIVRDNSLTQDAHLCNTPLLCSKNSFTVTATPSFDFTTEVSADGAYLYIRPTGFLQPNTQYTLQVDGDIYIGGLSLGNLTIGGKKNGTFAKTFSFKTEPVQGAFPLAVSQNSVTALEWTRLAIPLPSMMPSLNQIGFDYMDWIMAPVWVSQPDSNGAGTFIVWVIGGKKDANGVLVPDPKSDFTLAFNGRYDGSSYILENQNVTIPVTGIPIPFNFLQMRGQLTSRLTADPGTTIYADTQVMKIPTFGPYLAIAGLANNIYQKLVVSGTYIIEPYQSTVAADEPPSGVTVSQVIYQPPTSQADGSVTATIQVDPGVSYSPDDHRPGILLVDAYHSQAIYLDYLNDLSSTMDANGNLKTITLKLPAGTDLPKDLDAYVMLDVFPAYHTHLQAP
ncbi:MAG TPA: PQQ-binding-like beta-propeller repeat protein, partial [Longilinea sp.]|nr:PQQ-binding-like beta-propeller repeat protein [Longilinea sp.]